MKSPREKFYRRCEDRLALRIIKRNLDFYLSELSSFFVYKDSSFKTWTIILERNRRNNFKYFFFLFLSFSIETNQKRATVSEKLRNRD